jgi:hypothetical protein
MPYCAATRKAQLLWSKEKKLGYRKYYQQMYMAKKRVDIFNNPILMLLTFEEWWAIWQESGHWTDRGTHKGQYVMARFGDTGHYQVGNVSIQLSVDNVAYSHLKMRGKPKNLPKCVCPHCSKVGYPGPMARWHFDNCKLRSYVFAKC